MSFNIFQSTHCQPTEDEPARKHCCMKTKCWQTPQINNGNLCKYLLQQHSTDALPHAAKVQADYIIENTHAKQQTTDREKENYCKYNNSVSPSGKNQSACWIIGSMMASTCTDVAAAISASVLSTSTETEIRTGGRSVSLRERRALHFRIMT